MIATFLYIVLAVLGFSLLVLIHELGHFMVAKALKMDVKAFSLGFGPHIGRSWRGTEYRLSAIPVGGYVDLVGEEREEGRPPTPQEFLGRPPSQRACVFAAGSIMNGFLAFVGFIVAFAIGVPIPPAIVGTVIPGSPAWKAGLQVNDRIEALGSVHTSLDFMDVQAASVLASPGKPIAMTVQRDHKQINFRIIPEYDASEGIPLIGIGPKQSLKVVGLLASGDHGYTKAIDRPGVTPPAAAPLCPAFAAGLEIGDEIVEVNGKKVDDPQDLQLMVLNSEGRPMHVVYTRGGKTAEADVKPAPQGDWLIGIDYGSTKIRAVRSNTWAEKAGLKQGDVITRVNDQNVTAISQLKDALDRVQGDVTLTIADASTHTVKITQAEAGEINDFIAFEPDDIVGRPISGFPAVAAGLVPGDRIISLDGKSPNDLEAQAERGTKADAEPIHVIWEHAGARKSADITPQRRWGAGLIFGNLEELKRLSLWPACAVGTRKALRWIPRIYIGFKSLLTGSVSAKQVHGPIVIAQVTYQSAKRGAGVFAYFLAYFSLNLALLNLLPIPVLDGGHLLFTLIEKIKGSPVSEHIQAVTSYVGLTLLVALMIFATFNDFRSLLGM